MHERRGPEKHLRADAELVGIVEGKGDDRRRQAFRMPVELADLNLGPEPGMLHREAGKRDILAQDWRARRARDAADLGATDVHTIARRCQLIAD